MHALRLSEWSDQRLKEEGYMLNGLRVEKVKPQPKRDDGGVVYEFSKPLQGKRLQRLTGHKFL